jgi:hypothetical protein
MLNIMIYYMKRHDVTTMVVMVCNLNQAPFKFGDYFATSTFSNEFSKRTLFLLLNKLTN